MSTDYKEINEWEVMTPSGWRNFSGIKKTKSNKHIIIEFDDGTSLACSMSHKIKRSDEQFIPASKVKTGTKIVGKDLEIKKVSKKKIVNGDIDLYDLMEVDGGNEFYSNGVVSHNCAFIDGIEEIWLSAQSTLSTGGKATILSCVTADTYVFDEKIGLTQMSNYIQPDKIGPYITNGYGVLGKNRIRNGTYFHNNGRVETKVIKTKFSELECSLNHKLWAYKSSEKKYGWIKSEDLGVGDFLSIQRGMDIWINNDCVNDFVPSVSNKIQSPFSPKKLTPDICYLLGLYISEGSVYKVKNNDGKLTGGTLTITCGDGISQIFDRLSLTYSTSDNLHYCVSNKNLIEFLEYLGFDLSLRANEKIIPQRLMSISKDNMAHLLRGIFDGDGSGTANRVILGVTSSELISQVRMILNNFGILCSRFRHTKEKKNSYGGKIKHNHDTHTLEIYGRNALKFFNEINFGIERKSEGIKKILGNNFRRSCSLDVIPNSLSLMKELYVASGETTRTIKDKFGLQLNGIVNTKTRYKTENVSADSVRIMYYNYKHLLSEKSRNHWDNIIDDSTVWCEIKSITRGYSETYDFSLPDNPNDCWDHSVIYNGVVGHQTPNGVGNFFHKKWVEAESGEALEGMPKFNPISLPWKLHPERDQTWRDLQTKNLGPKGAAQECFEGNTRIYTKDGLKKIKEIEVGDLVLTHTGKFSRVVRKYEKTATDLVSIYSSINRKSTIVTKNHPFLSRDEDWIEIGSVLNETALCSFPIDIDTSYISNKNEVVDLYKIIDPDHFRLMLCNQDKSIYVNDREHKTVHNRFISIDEDFGFLLGLYMSEGWCEANRVYFCFNWDTEKSDWPLRLENIITQKLGISSFQYRKCGNNSGQLTVCSQILSKILKYFVDGSDCYNKALSKKSFNLFNLDAWRGFCDGAFVGDGMVLDKYSKTFTSRSEEFALNIKYGLHLLGYGLVSYSVGKTNHEPCYIIKILGTAGLACENRMLSSMSTPSEYRTKNIHGLDRDYQYSTVYFNSDEVAETVVYNLEVEGEHTYVTEHFVVHNCDCEFSTSGNTVIEIPLIQWYEKTHMTDPLEKRGFDKGYWIWKYPEAGKSYMVVGDVARGDGSDYSASHIIEIETMEQVAEYKGKLPTKEYAQALMTMATEYNKALLVIENANVGWAVIQEVIDKNYDNLFYSSADLQYVDVETQMTNKINTQEKKMTPGFTTSNKSRPLLISKLESYIRNKEVIIHSKRLLDELNVFIWKSTGTSSAKAEAMDGYNDDLVMAMAIGLWIRDVALRLRSEADSISKTILSKIGSTSSEQIKNNMTAVYKTQSNPFGAYNNPWKMNVGGASGDKTEDITWLLR